jgi:type IV pilus assembly protein PilY1
MFKYTRQTILASRPAAMVLALTLVAGLTAPFVMLPRARAASTAATTSCSVANNNGCTELSASPPEDTVSVPPNIMLMLDDSGSMAWDYMPDACYLYGVTCTGYQNGTNPINGQGVDSITGVNNDAMIDASNNGVYYNPTITYSPPPQANGTLYPSYSDITSVPVDGFASGGNKNLTNYSDKDLYGENDYLSNYLLYYSTSNTQKVPVSGQFDQTVNGTCRTHHGSTTCNPTAQTVCADDYNSDGGTGGYTFSGNDESGECKFTYSTYQYTTYYYFQYSTGSASGPYTDYYVAPASQGCGTQTNCVLDTDTSGTAAPAGVAVGENIANWFAYYHTRILMAKSGLMTAFNNLSSNYRFGFGSIDGNDNGNITSLGKSNYTTSDGYTLAEVQPFGASTDSTSQRYNFWKWIANESAGSGTPLRSALKSVGDYYETSQPWSTMEGDPGYGTTTTTYACRSSYTILTTDGFWNGSSPNVGNADGNNGNVYSVPSGDTTTGYVAAQPYSDNQSNTLADVAMYYWETDLQPSIDNEVATSTDDPAAWQHMTTFTMGLGFSPYGITPTGTTVDQILSWADGGTAISGFSWPTPASNSLYNIADLAHAGVNGHGGFFSVKSPADLAADFSAAISQISARNVAPSPQSVNASVLSVGALTFETGYSTSDWSGTFEAVSLNPDGTTGSGVWSPEPDAQLDDDYHSTNYVNRVVYTDAYDSTKSAPFSSFQFDKNNSGSLDTAETAGLESPALSGSNDSLNNRINFLLGDNEYEGTTYRTRTHLLGAIVNSQPVYVSTATGDYYDDWPSGSPEISSSAKQTYDQFVSAESSRAGTVYVGANDGMLHAFNAPVPSCTTYTSGTCSAYDYGTNPGKEDWAFIPRAVYANLGNLTSTDFTYRPTVDETPVTRDVFFSEGGAGNEEWHTILAGGVGLGGRGVYALDITDPTVQDFDEQPMTKYPASGVLWEFDSDMTVSSSCVATYGSCQATDLGYTVSQPNIGRLADGKWAVLVPNGYFPDCTATDTPTNDTTNCDTISAQAPKDSNGKPYSALFVLDAQTGSVIAELKTPTDAGVTSFGLATPVLGDYNNDQVDDVAFAGDVEGNLWRFDFSSSDPSKWTVTLAYKGLTNTTTGVGEQPITTMPRLFPDPTTNRFMVVFGTGRFLGVGDNSDNTVQAIYGIRDQGSSATSAGAYTQSDLVEQYLHEETETSGTYAGDTLRCVTGSASDTSCDSTSNPAPTPTNDVPADKGGWFINLETTASDGTQTDAGERVVVTPGAIFASNTVVFETLITGSSSSDPCSPSTQGAIMALDATTGGAAGVSSLGGWPLVGGRISNAHTGGSLPVVSALGGGQAYLPGTTLEPSGTGPLSVDAPIWRRRSWQEINEND